MAKLRPDPADRAQFVRLLIAAEILARRGETGPLARTWRAVGPRRRSAEKQPVGKDKGHRGD